MILETLPSESKETAKPQILLYTDLSLLQTACIAFKNEEINNADSLLKISVGVPDNSKVKTIPEID